VKLEGNFVGPPSKGCKIRQMRNVLISNIYYTHGETEKSPHVIFLYVVKYDY